MTRNDLFDGVMNERKEYDAVVFAVNQLRRTIDRAAERLAKANRDWHDDPEAEDHKAFQAPTEVQFPKQTRDAAILDIVKYLLKELNP